MRKPIRRVAIPTALLVLASCAQRGTYEFHATGRGDGTSVIYRCDPVTGEAWLGSPANGWLRIEKR